MYFNCDLYCMARHVRRWINGSECTAGHHSAAAAASRPPNAPQRHAPLLNSQLQPTEKMPDGITQSLSIWSQTDCLRSAVVLAGAGDRSSCVRLHSGNLLLAQCTPAESGGTSTRSLLITEYSFVRLSCAFSMPARAGERTLVPTPQFLPPQPTPHLGRKLQRAV
jgi:hypothetical protein